MASRLSLLGLPNELFDQTLGYLDLASIQNLRLVSKSAADKCLQSSFKRYYRDQETDLSPVSLDHLFNIASHPTLGPAIQHLTVVVKFYDPSHMIELVQEARGSATWNNDDASNLRKVTAELYWIQAKRMEQKSMYIDQLIAILATLLRTLGTLKTLKLRSGVLVRDVRKLPSHKHEIPDPWKLGKMNWPDLWADCSRAFFVVTKAMFMSSVRVDTFSVFDGCYGSIQSWALTAVTSMLQRLGFSSAVGEKIKNLTLSFSPRTHEPSIIFIIDGNMNDLVNVPPIRLDASGPLAMDARNFDGVAALLKQTPNIESLDLHMYDTLRGTPWEYAKMFGNVSTEIKLPKLRRLTLRGIRTTTGALLLFLQNHPRIVELHLQDVYVNGGSWSPIFEQLTSMARTDSLTKLHLENLWKSRKLINLQPTVKTFDDGQRGHGHSFRSRNNEDMVHTRDISVEELRQGLEFMKHRGSSRAKGSREMIMWNNNRRKLYGPPPG